MWYSMARSICRSGLGRLRVFAQRLASRERSFHVEVCELESCGACEDRPVTLDPRVQRTLEDAERTTFELDSDELISLLTEALAKEFYRTPLPALRGDTGALQEFKDRVVACVRDCLLKHYGADVAAPLDFEDLVEVEVNRVGLVVRANVCNATRVKFDPQTGSEF